MVYAHHITQKTMESSPKLKKAPIKMPNKMSNESQNKPLGEAQSKTINTEFVEENFKNKITLRFPVTRELFHEKSEFQEVRLVETPHHGRVLFLDGCVMVTERDEFVYHEMMAHVPLCLHPHPQRVLIIGGGDGGTAREVLRHPSVEECVMVEIDPMVIEVSRQHLPSTSVSFHNPKLQLIVGDGVQYVAEQASSKKIFDVILVDSTDPIGPAQPLFGPEFYGNVRRCLNKNGIVVAQGESPFYERETQIAMKKVVEKEFSKVHFYNFTNMTYPGGLWSFLFASNEIDPILNFDLNTSKNRISEFQANLKYFNPSIQRSSFDLPSFMEAGHLHST